jgi:predicted transposase YdaD
LLALKHIFDPTPKQALADLIPLIREILDRETAMEMLEVLLHYYVQTTQVLDEEDIRELISTDEEDLMQTFIDRYIEQGKQQGWIGGRQEGRQEGKQEGKQEGQKELLLRLLTRKFGPLTEHHHHRVEQANGETLLRWSEQTLFASTVEEALK